MKKIEGKEFHTISGSLNRQRIPVIICDLAVIACLWTCISYPLHHVFPRFVLSVNRIFMVLNIPAGSSLLDFILLLIFAVAVARRKKIALIIMGATQGISCFISLAHCVTEIILLKNHDPDFSRPQLIFFVLSAIFGFTMVVVTFAIGHLFPGRMVHGSFRGALAILLVGLGSNFLLGLLVVTFGPLRHMHNRFVWLAYRVFGSFARILIRQPIPARGPVWVSIPLSFISIFVAVAAVIFFLRGQNMPGRTIEDDLFTRRLLNRWGNDSLGYFATRGDRAIIASSDKKAGVSYGLAAGVSVAGGDPLGDPQSWNNAITQWRSRCIEYGWVPAALSVSEEGARAYKKQGFIVFSMGDEAVIDVVHFDINSPKMKPLQQSVRRCSRAGIDISIRKLNEIGEEERRDLIDAANRFRVGSERGFSMSLDRILSPVDGSTTVVSARNTKGELSALLTFVPWGARGLSLTHMRRDPQSVNGIVEAMVVALIESSREGIVEKISLNFAVLRHFFTEGEAVTARMHDRIFRRGLQFASRFWQLESLYQSNSRYQPNWVPRYACVRSYTETTAMLVASAMLEGFLPRISADPGQTWSIDQKHIDAIREIEKEGQTQLLSVVHTEQERIRRAKAVTLANRGMEPWPASVSLGNKPAEVQSLGKHLTVGQSSDIHVHIGGRIRAIRDHGGIIFADIERGGATSQIILDRSAVEEKLFGMFRLIDIGDIISVEGTVVRSHMGEISVFVHSWVMAAKALRPLPRQNTELDARTRSRERVLSLIVDPTKLALLQKRSQVIAQIRTILHEQGYTEVETPMIHPVKGGANARPFITHLNAYSTDVFLRIAPELYLKRLMVGGMEAIFELGRSFRNEGADSTHNPEFTSLEVYRAGGDYTLMRHLTQDLIQRAAQAIHGACVCLRPEGSIGVEDVEATVEYAGVKLAPFDLSQDWPVITVYDAISSAVGVKVTPDTSITELTDICGKNSVDLPPTNDKGSLIGCLYDELVEARTITPTFYTDFPASSSPLTRKHRRDPRLAERWDLVAFGMELGTAYTELTDPLDQRERFTAQSLAAAAGDPEAMSIDENFLRDLERGMPPTGGLGIGVDRLVMLLTGMPIRQVLTFPYVRPTSNMDRVR